MFLDDSRSNNLVAGAQGHARVKGLQERPSTSSAREKQKKEQSYWLL